MIYYREHRGGLKESLKTLKKFKDIGTFIIWYYKTHDCTVFQILRYSDSPDNRISWPYTLLVVDNQFSKNDDLFPSGFLCDTRFNNFSEFSFYYTRVINN